MQGQEAALHQAHQAFRAWREEEGREVLGEIIVAATFRRNCSLITAVSFLWIKSV